MAFRVRRILRLPSSVTWEIRQQVCEPICLFLFLNKLFSQISRRADISRLSLGLPCGRATAELATELHTAEMNAGNRVASDLLRLFDIFVERRVAEVRDRLQ